jgi:hypothetical protein
MSAGDGADGVPVSDRWAQTQPIAIIPTTTARDARRRNKENPFNQAATYLQVYPRNKIVAHPIGTAGTPASVESLFRNFALSE